MIFEDHPSPKKLSDQGNPAVVIYFIEELKNLYGMEKDLLEVLGRFQKQVHTEEFIQVLIKYSSVTSKNIERLEQVFVLADIPISSKNSPLLQGLMQECKSATEKGEKDMASDLKLSILTAHFNSIHLAIHTQLLALTRKMQLHELTVLLQENILEEKNIGSTIESCIHIELISKLQGLG